KVKMEDGRAVLSPLRFWYDADRVLLPLGIALANGGSHDVVVHVLAKGKRYDATGRPALLVPTNLEVTESARDVFDAFYGTLFDRTLAKNPHGVVTEYAHDAAACDGCPEPPL